MSTISTHGRPLPIDEIDGEGPAPLNIPQREVWRWYAYTRFRENDEWVWRWRATCWGSEDKEKAIGYRDHPLYHTEFKPDVPQRLVKEIVTYEILPFDEELHDRLIEAYEATKERHRAEDAAEAQRNGGADDGQAPAADPA